MAHPFQNQDQSYLHAGSMLGNRTLLLLLVGLICLCGLLQLRGYSLLSTLPMSSLLSSVKRALKHQPRLIVVGSGLGGTSAALAAVQADPGLEVVVLEKEAKPGGNSVKASSGINAVTPETGDDAEAFRSDTTRSGGGLSRPELVSTLVDRSQEAIGFLEAAGLNLSGVVQLGGHTKKRTHHNLAGPNVGTAIMRALHTQQAATPSIKLVTSAQVTGLLTSGGRVQGVTYRSEDGGSQELPGDAVVVATGGFGANRDLLRKYAPQVAELGTTNGAWAQGEGLDLSQQAGAALLDMEQVQVHPTGFVDPANPDNKSKFLAPEKLRGVGGILLSKQSGRRFVNELSTRNVVAKAILGEPEKEAYLLLGSAAAQLFGPTLDFYASKGFFAKLESPASAAAHMGVDEAVVREELDAYNAAAAAGQDGFGKAVFPTTIDPAQALYVARITPVIHYTMGGVAINPEAQVLDGQGTPIPGLFAAGEVTGGLHGANRLGGNSLLDCVVFGRQAGASAAAYVADLRREDALLSDSATGPGTWAHVQH